MTNKSIIHLESDKYKTRISRLFSQLDEDIRDFSISIDFQNHFSKYICVLVSGYLEQSIKELLLEYGRLKSNKTILNYLSSSWPKSRNMNASNIEELLGQFDNSWKDAFKDWVEDEHHNRKSDINSLVTWRNAISHGNESQTNGVTINSIKQKFQTCMQLVNFLRSVLVE